MTPLTYFMLRFKSRNKLPAALAVIEKLNGIDHLTAVDGYYSLVAEATDRGNELAVTLERIDGAGTVDRCEVIEIEDKVRDTEEMSRCGFVFIEADSNEIDRLWVQLKQNNGVTRLARTSGSFDFVATIQGNDFDQIDRIVADELPQLAGILRLKSSRVIDLDAM